MTNYHLFLLVIHLFSLLASVQGQDNPSILPSDIESELEISTETELELEVEIAQQSELELAIETELELEAETTQQSEVDLAVEAELEADRAQIQFSLAPPLVGLWLRSVNNEKAYACPEGYAYLSYEDAWIFNQDTCDSYSNDSTYRLAGGGSASGADRQCRVSFSDPEYRDKAVCVKSDITHVLPRNRPTCPDGTSLVSLEEVEADLETYCGTLGDADFARIGFMGSLSGPKYGCKIRVFDSRDIGPKICVRRKIRDIKIVDSNEDICGEGKALLTVQEALNNQKYYCTHLPLQLVVRLAGGGSIDGYCNIKDADRRQVDAAFCANVRD